MRDTNGDWKNRLVILLFSMESTGEEGRPANQVHIDIADLGIRQT